METSTLPELFHYTSPAGLIGMQDQKRIRLTHINYLNDSDEYYHAFDLFREVLKKDFPGYKFLDEYFNRSQPYDVFSFSLTEEGDLLSQWRGYCPTGGYAVSFKNESLVKWVKDNGLTLRKCIYGQSDKENVLKNSIESQIAHYTKRMPTLTSEHLSAIISLSLIEWAPFFKQEAFNEEKEWRITSNRPMSSNPPILSEFLSFRSGNQMIIPY